MPRSKLQIALFTLTVAIVADGFITNPGNYLPSSWTGVFLTKKPSLVSTNAGNDNFLDPPPPTTTKTTTETTIEAESTATDNAKERYLLLAKEAYEKYYSKPPDGRQQLDGAAADLAANDDGLLSQEEYLDLALTAWDNGVAKEKGELLVNERQEEDVIDLGMNSNDGDSGVERSSLPPPPPRPPLPRPPFPDDARSTTIAQREPANGDIDNLSTVDDETVTNREKEDANIIEGRQPSSSPLPDSKSNDIDNNEVVSDRNTNKFTSDGNVSGSRSKKNNNPLLDIFSKFMPSTSGDTTAAADSSSSSTGTKFNPMEKLFDTIDPRRKRNDNDGRKKFDVFNGPGSSGADYGEGFFEEESSVPYGLRAPKTVEPATTEERRPVEPDLSKKRYSSNDSAGNAPEINSEKDESGGIGSSPLKGGGGKGTIISSAEGSKKSASPQSSTKLPSKGETRNSFAAGSAKTPITSGGVRDSLNSLKGTEASNKGIANGQSITKKGPSFANNWKAKGSGIDFPKTPLKNSNEKQQQVLGPGPGKDVPLTKSPFGDSAKSPSVMGAGVPKSLESLKGVASKVGVDATKKAFSFGKSTTAEGDVNISLQPPTTKYTDNNPKLSKSLPIMKKSSFAKSSSVMVGVSKSMDSMKGAAAKSEGLNKGVSFGNLKKVEGVSISPQSPLQPTEDKQQQVTSPGLGKTTMPFAKKSVADAKSSYMGGVSNPFETLKGAAAKVGRPAKGLAGGILKKADGGFISPQSPLKTPKVKEQQVVIPGMDESMPFVKKSVVDAKSSSVVGKITKSPESLKGFAANVDGSKKGFPLGDTRKADGGTMSPQSPLQLTKDKEQQVVSPGLGKGMPSMKNSPGPKSSSIAGGIPKTMESLKGAVPKANGPTNSANEESNEYTNSEEESVNEVTLMEIANALTKPPPSQKSTNDYDEDEKETVSDFLDKAEEAWADAMPPAPPKTLTISPGSSERESPPKPTMMKGIMKNKLAGAGARESFLSKKGVNPYITRQKSNESNDSSSGDASPKIPSLSEKASVIGNKGMAQNAAKVSEKDVAEDPPLSLSTKSRTIPKIPSVKGRLLPKGIPKISATVGAVTKSFSKESSNGSTIKSLEPLKGTDPKVGGLKKGFTFGNFKKAQGDGDIPPQTPLKTPTDKQQQVVSMDMGKTSMPFMKKSGAESSSVLGEGLKSPEPLKGSVAKGEGLKKGFPFGILKKAEGGNDSQQLPLSSKVGMGQQVPNPGLGKTIMPSMEKLAGAKTSPFMGQVSTSLEPLKGAAAKVDGLKKVLSSDNGEQAKGGSISSQKPLNPSGDTQQVVDLGLGKMSIPFVKKSFGAKSSSVVGEVPKSPGPLKGAVKVDDLKKGLSFGTLKAEGVVSSQPSRKDTTDKQTVAVGDLKSPKKGNSSTPFTKEPSITEPSSIMGGIKMSLESFKGADAKVGGLKKGFSFGNFEKAQGDSDISPQTPLKTPTDKQQQVVSMDMGKTSMPFMKKSGAESTSVLGEGLKSPEPLKGSVAKGEGLEKGFPFGILKKAEGGNDSQQLPLSSKVGMGQQVPNPGLGKTIMPSMKKLAGAKTSPFMGQVSKSLELSKGTDPKVGNLKKGFSFGNFKKAQGDGDILPLTPLKTPPENEQQVVSMDMGKTSMPFMKKSGAESSSVLGEGLKSPEPLKGSVAKGEGLEKGFPFGILKKAEGGNNPQQLPLSSKVGMGQQVPNPGLGKTIMPSMEKLAGAKTTPFMGQVSTSFEPLKGAAAKVGGLKKVLSSDNGEQAKGGSISSQKPLNPSGDTQQVVGLGLGKMSIPFVKKSFGAKSSSVVGEVPKSPGPLKGAVKAEDPKKGLSFGNLKAEGAVSSQPPQVGSDKILSLGNMKAGGATLPQPPSLIIKDNQSVSVPFTKKSSNPVKVDGLDALNASKGAVPKVSPPTGKSDNFLGELKQSPTMPKGSTTGPSSSFGLKMPLKGQAPNEMASNTPFGKKSGLFPKGKSKQIADLVSPSSLATELPASQAAFAQTTGDSEGVNIEGYSADLSQVVSSANTDDEAENLLSMMAAEDKPWLESIGDIIMDGEGNPTLLPLLHITNRIGSSVHGTTHEGFLVLSTEDTNDGVDIILNGNGYKVITCTAKRPWSMAELNATVPNKVVAFEQLNFDAVEDEPTPESWELEAKAGVIRSYWEVEMHMFQKFEQKKALYERLSQQKQQDEERQNGSGSRTKDEKSPSIKNSVANIVAPKFLRVYPDDGSGGPRADDAIPEYGLTGVDVWGKALGVGHEWLVFEGRLDAEPTLFDAMEMQHQADDQNIQNGSKHNLYGIQQAMHLPDSYDFGDVLDAIFRCLLEDLVFLSSCNVVHRDLRPVNILCDGENQRLRLTNFGNSADLDPPRVGLENSSLDAPGSIANTLAADVYSVALIVCQLLFDSSDLNQPLKDVGYDLDMWLQKELTADSCPLGFGYALDYLRERPGLWSLLKGAIRPNPLRKKITADSLRQFNEIMGYKRGENQLTQEMTEKIAMDESVLDPNRISPTEVEPGKQTSNRASFYRDDEEVFDITTAPYRLKPPTKSSVSALSELQRKAERSAPNMKASSEYVDVTRLKFSPTRKSILTNMLTSYAKKTSTGTTRQKREVRERNYYDIKRPHPSERKMTQNKATTKGSIKVVDILAPAGKLGVVVDNSPTGGPTYISSISDNSPLLSLIYLGDIIVAVDDEDVQQLTADDISKILLSKSANALRKISLVREIGDEDELPDSDILMKETGDDADVTHQEDDSQEKFAQTFTLTKAQISADEKRYKEVEQWLSYQLPGLKKDDASTYCQALIDDGFDSSIMLEELIEEDLYFLKTAHRRVLSRKLFGPTNANTPALLSASDQQSSAVKKVYKVDEALGMAARLGIERKLKEEKRLSEVERKINEARKRVEAETRVKAEEEDRLRKFSSEKDEMDQKINEAKQLIEYEARVKADEEAQLRIFEEEKRKLQQQLEAEAVARGRARQKKLERLQDEAERLKETEAWIAEQNELVKKRHRARIAKEKRLKEEEDRYVARQAEFKSLAEEKKLLKETEAWISEQNELVKKRNLARIAKEKQLKEDEETDIARQLEFEDKTKRLEDQAWIMEQNELVKKRRLARIAKEKQLEEDEGDKAPLPEFEDKAKRLEDEAWITEQNESVKKRHLVRIAEENTLKGDADLSDKETATTPKAERRDTSPNVFKSSGENIAPTKQFYTTEGLTAEEAELVRKSRLAQISEEKKLKGDTDPSGKETATTPEAERRDTYPNVLKSSGENIAPTKQLYMAEGLTAEEAELVRKARLDEADNTKEQKLRQKSKPSSPKRKHRDES